MEQPIISLSLHLKGRVVLAAGGIFCWGSPGWQAFSGVGGGGCSGLWIVTGEGHPH